MPNTPKRPDATEPPDELFPWADEPESVRAIRRLGVVWPEVGERSALAPAPAAPPAAVSPPSAADLDTVWDALCLAGCELLKRLPHFRQSGAHGRA